MTDKSDTSQTPTKFSEVALPLLDLGYEPLPIVPGTKRPEKGWAAIELTQEVCQQWCDNGKGAWPCGVRGGTVIGVDIDITDEKVAEDVQGLAEFHLGYGPTRVGQPPKRLLPYRAAKGEVIRKLLMEWEDPSGKRHRVEILATGQQFLGYGVHIITGEPYYYVDGKGLLETPVDQLTEVSQADLAAFMDHLAAFVPSNWRLVSSSAPRNETEPDCKDKDEAYLSHHREPGNESADVVRALLTRLDPDVIYDKWFLATAAVHHWSQGSDEGREIWETWSRGGKKWKNADAKKWENLKPQLDDRDPITLRSLIRLIEEEEGRTGVVKQTEWESAREIFPRVRFPWGVLPAGFAKNFQQLARSHATSPDTIPGAAFGLIASGVGGTVSVSAKDSWTEPLIFWHADIRPSGTGKTSAPRALCKPLYEAQKASDLEYERMTAEEDAKPKKERQQVPRPRSYYGNDLTIEGVRRDMSGGHGGIALLMDELSAFVTSQNQYKKKGSDR